jgi:hypothetical protein
MSHPFPITAAARPKEEECKRRSTEHETLNSKQLKEDIFKK